MISVIAIKLYQSTNEQSLARVSHPRHRVIFDWSIKLCKLLSCWLVVSTYMSFVKYQLNSCMFSMFMFMLVRCHISWAVNIFACTYACHFRLLACLLPCFYSMQICLYAPSARLQWTHWNRNSKTRRRGTKECWLLFVSISCLFPQYYAISFIFITSVFSSVFLYSYIVYAWDIDLNMYLVY